MLFSWDDLQSFCDDLSNWIIELGLEGEMKHSFPKGSFPLKAEKDLDDLENGLDVLIYLTLWMCLKTQQKAPSHLESRIVLSPKTKGPWQTLYFRFCEKLDKKIRIEELWDLAS